MRKLTPSTALMSPTLRSKTTPLVIGKYFRSPRSSTSVSRSAIGPLSPRHALPIPAAHRVGIASGPHDGRHLCDAPLLRIGAARRKRAAHGELRHVRRPARDGDELAA